MAEEHLNDQMQVRRDKMQSLRERGIDPFGQRFAPDHSTSSEVRAKYGEDDGELLLQQGNVVTIAGRLIGKRGSGKASFADLLDRDGKIQIYVRQDRVGEESYQLFKESDLGDFWGITGDVIKTRMGELTVRANQITFLTKALRPLPDKYHGLQDPELIYRQRYLDLITNQESLERFKNRTKIIKAIRRYMDENDFMEVETPMLETVASGADARPFETHHNALNIEMYLRIATELRLKRLIVGGLDRVYELGRVFRNEGMDPRHNPEFDTMETYAAYFDFNDVMAETEGIFKAAAKVMNHDMVINYQGTELDFSKPFTRMHMVDAIKETTGIDFWEPMTDDQARQLADDNGVKYESWWKVGHIINAFFEEKVQDQLEQPVFIYGHPVEISPLARKNKDDERFTDRAELYILGSEYANMFTELNDPIDQRARFEAQAQEHEAGNDEFQPIDEDFVEALEYGMPPTGGLGVGIDRLVMLMTDAKSIRDVLLFPTMRLKK
ncbi:lysine--tRNA ligase [Limosilactobacillus gastricus]|uniref:Lysine--tRNA ligase n=1 Tax=Limosilactobacillus gastricus DSM 16045 TaxID=1423749 RepID=A0A0R1V5C0_9LACO|nr:lysine--tRNA ligase [Limosilactobacillus gastricus]KRM00719.1 Lysyl-tRNA synthetase [Limosilactobacillus gastricus DSM 16045]QGF40957.1 lysine--tRNA ligase [Limosilactobacillus gastricus]